MYHNIPLELQQLRQWVCWRYEEVNGRQTKVPYCPSPHAPQKASVLNPATWGTFEDAVRMAVGPTMNGIGLVLTEEDPYTGIDIDDKPENPASEAEKAAHARILEAFQSYTERSVGGRGYHIIIRGKIQGGRDRGHVGVYSTARYLTFSGEVVRNAPIIDCQELLDALVAEMPYRDYAGELDEVEGHLTDQELHEMALAASNGEKYAALTRGEWQELGYPSQSEADLALLSIYAFYTRDNSQVRRMFRYTALGKRPKAQANDNYINRTLRIIRSKQPNEAQIDASRAFAAANAPEVSAPSETAVTSLTPVKQPGLTTQAQAEAYARQQLVPARVAPAPPAPAPITGARAPSAYTPPPGLIGDLARYFYSTAVRPLQEAALSAAIGIVAGVAGRAYNISGTGLNQYILFLGKTGTGKEGMAKGIAKLMAHTRVQVPMVDDFLGPSAFASGQGLIRVLDQKPSFISILGEFGLTLQALSDPRAPAPVVILRKVLLDLYTKSGWEDVLQSTAYSDVEKNTKVVHAPCVTLLAESTPETFYDGIDASDIADGLIPRFHVIEYTGGRSPRNKNAGGPPPPELVQRFADLCAAALTSQHNNTCAAVSMEAGAQTLLDEFDVYCDEQLNRALNSGEAQLYNRAHLKALKLAGIIAVGCNPHVPVVTTEHARWAIQFTLRGTEQVLSRFSVGDVGTGDSKQISDVKRIVEAYFKMGKDQLKTYQIKPEMQAAGIVPYRYLVQRLARLGAFAHEKIGAINAVKNILGHMAEMEVLGELSAEQMQQRFGTKQKGYFLGAAWQ